MRDRVSNIHRVFDIHAAGGELIFGIDGLCEGRGEEPQEAEKAQKTILHAEINSLALRRIAFSWGYVAFVIALSIGNHSTRSTSRSCWEGSPSVNFSR